MKLNRTSLDISIGSPLSKPVSKIYCAMAYLLRNTIGVQLKTCRVVSCDALFKAGFVSLLTTPLRQEAKKNIVEF